MTQFIPGSPLTDAFGRVAADLRISVTDRCNFRCTYCMLPEGAAWLSQTSLLTAGEIERVARIFCALGIKEVKLTGGEPTVRPDLAAIIRRIRAAGPHLDISMTTNGFRLSHLAKPLKEAGLDRVTVSCDSLMRHRFAEMSRRDALERVQAGIGAAIAAGLHPLKINCVVIRGTNDDEACAFAALARRTGQEVRFIEYMPLDAGQEWERGRVVPSSELAEQISAVYPLAEDPPGPGPARTFRFADGAPGSVGFISSVTEPFCDRCNRLRLTADGQLRTCLFSLGETDLRTLLRGGASDAEIEGAVRAGVAGKWAGHRINHPDFVRPARSMSMIGG